MRVAALDLGTNTFLLLIADTRGGMIERVITDRARVVRLGQGVHQSRRFHPDALQRADACLAEYAAEIARHSVDRIVACATSAARDVSNRDELLDLGKKHSVPIEIISGDREAECTFRGTVGATHSGTVGIIDVGGGSTEFIIGDASGIRHRRSIDIGAVRLTEMFVSQHPVPESERAAMAGYIREKLSALGAEYELGPAGRVMAVAGTATTLATLDMGRAFDADVVHGYRLPAGRLAAWHERLASLSVAQRQALAGMDEKRADVIAAGSLILSMGCAVLGAGSVEISVRGLRYGLACEAV